MTYVFNRMVEKDPEAFSKRHKIHVVNNYLQTREIKSALDHKPKTPEGLLQVHGVVLEFSMHGR